MTNPFEFIRATRKNVLKIIQQHDLEALNLIPPGFNNNLIWNAGHIIATQQLLTYGLSGLPTVIHKDYIEKYRKGTKPTDSVNNTEYESLKELLFTAIDKTEEDYKAGKFENFKTYETSFGVTLNNIEEAIVFNNIHEGMHLGNIISMKKLV